MSVEDFTRRVERANENFRITDRNETTVLFEVAVISSAVTDRIAGRTVVAIDGVFRDNGTNLTPIGGGGSGGGGFILLNHPLAAGTNLVTHNLGLASPFIAGVETRDPVTGAVVDVRVVRSTRTANTLELSVPVAGSVDIFITRVL